MILFIANGHPPFPLELAFYLLEALKREGLGDGWDRVSLEWDFDSKRFSVAEAVTFQVSEAQLLKFYQHGNTARLEGADRRILSLDDTFLCLNEAWDRTTAKAAMREATRLRKDVNGIAADNRKLNNYLTSLSDRVHSMDDKKKGRRTERPLIPGAKR